MALQPAVSTPLGVAVPVEPTAQIIRSVRAALGQGEWLGLDGHVHTDHSHDAGFFHQQSKRPENHDTFVRDQVDEAERVGENFVVLTDHQTFDGAYDPEFFAAGATVMGGEELGGYPHATAWGITESLVQGPDLGECGLTLAAREVRAQDAIFGVAHPEDGRRECITTETLRDIPIDHLEAFRSPHTEFFNANIAADNRLVPVTGSDNHFRQLHGTEAGVGGNSTLIYAESQTQAAIVDAVRAGRVTSVTRMLGPTLTTLLDADDDGVFEAMTGGWGEPTGPTVRVAFEARNAVGLRLQVLDDETMFAETLITKPIQLVVYDLPAGRPLWRGQLDESPVGRLTGGVVHDYLSYFDTLKLLSAPVYLTPPPKRDPGAAALLTDAPFAGFPDAAVNGAGDRLVVFQERGPDGYRIRIINHDSDDDGIILSEEGSDAREPAIAAEGSTVAVAYTDRVRTRLAGTILVRVSEDGGATFGDPIPVSKQFGAKPDIAISNGVVHIAWASMEDGFKIRYARLGDSSSTLLSSARTVVQGPATYSPTQMLRHVPAAIDPVLAVDGNKVVVAWSDNREDVTPLRNATPDDWGIYLARSSDAGVSWSTDSRISPRHDRTPPNPADPEKMVGNPAKHPAAAFLGGRLVVAWSDANGSASRIRSIESTDMGATWSGVAEIPTSSSEMSYRPQIGMVAGQAVVVWQQSEGKAWTVRAATISAGDTGAAFAGGPFAGYPALAGDTIFFTASGTDRYGIAATGF